MYAEQDYKDDVTEDLAAIFDEVDELTAEEDKKSQATHSSTDPKDIADLSDDAEDLASIVAEDDMEQLKSAYYLSQGYSPRKTIYVQPFEGEGESAKYAPGVYENGTVVEYIVADDQRLTPDQEKKKAWYIIQTSSGFEAKVITALKSKIIEYKYQAYFDAIVLPVERIARTTKTGKIKFSDSKIFPGYIFVKMILDINTNGFVKSIPQVRGFLEASKKDYGRPVSEAEMQVILDRMGREGARNEYQIGDRLIVLDGPMKGQEGDVIGLVDNNTLKLSIHFFNRETKVDVDIKSVDYAVKYQEKETKPKTTRKTKASTQDTVLEESF